MSIKTSELQQLQSILGTDCLLAETAAAGTGRLSLARAAEFFGAELVKPANPVGAALSNKAALSVQQTVEATTVPSRTVEVAAADLSAYIAGLPRLLTENLTIKVPGGTVATTLSITGFYGPGRILFEAERLGDVTLYVVELMQVNVPVYFHKIRFSDQADGPQNMLLQAWSESYVTLTNCEFAGWYQDHPTKTGAAIYGNGFCSITLRYTSIHDFPTAMELEYGAICCVVGDSTTTYTGNGNGIYVQSGGIVLLNRDTPDTVGGAANVKSGGLIAKYDGTLL